MNVASKFWNIFRSPLGDYCNELADPAGCYGEEVLSRIQQDGFNAVWLRVVLRDMVQTTVFPELSPRPDAIEALRDIVARCGRNGLGVFVYLNEPLGFPEDDEFWMSRPKLRGQRDISFDDGWDRANALCTSQPETLRFLEEGSRLLFQEVSGLAGAILISASEHLTHCYSHESKYRERASEEIYPLNCSRCAARKPWEIVGEVVGAIERGMHSASFGAQLIVWNWSWSYYETPPQKELIASLPASVAVMVDFERGGTQVLGLSSREVSIPVDEYSLGYTGPSEAFLTIGQEVQRSQRGLYAKLQIGTTHEIATVPNLPLIASLVRKLRHLESLGADGIVATWCMGTFASVNTFAVGWILRHPGWGDDETLSGIASAYFPGCEANQVARGWTRFDEAFQHFPQMQDLFYAGPINAAPAYPWMIDQPATPMRPTWFPPQPYGNEIREALGPLTLEEMIECFDKLLIKWREALNFYADGLNGCREHAARLEAGVAKMVGHQLASARNFMAFRREVLLGQFLGLSQLCEQEIAELKQILPLLDEDPRLGFHQGCFPKPRAFFDRASIEEKIADLEILAERFRN